MSDAKRSARGPSSAADPPQLADRWVVGVELAAVLQVAVLYLLYRAGTGAGADGLVGQVLSVGAVLVVVPLAYAVTLYAVWRDIELLEYRAGRDIAAWRWLVGCVLVPVAGCLAYIGIHGHTPTPRGVSGRLRTVVVGGQPASEEPAGPDAPGEPATTASHDQPVDDGVATGPSTVLPAEVGTADPAPAVDLGGDRENELPDYEDVETLHSGEGADVKRVRLSESGVEAAVKFPRSGGTVSTPVLEAFVEEAETWSSLDDHRNVLSVYGWGTLPHPWLCMEHVDADLRARAPDLGVAARLAVVAATCEGVYHGHEHGVAHLDLKPENVLVSRDLATVRVADWGSARQMLDDDAGHSPMTVAYAAPEQVDPDRFGDPSPRADVFQLGVVAYEALTDRRPFDRDTVDATMAAVTDETPPPPSAVADVDPAYDDAVLTALAKRPEERHESVLYLRDALEDV